MDQVQKQIAELKSRIDQLEARLGEVAGKLVDLKATMHSFLQRYQREILVYQEQLVEVQRQIADIKTQRGDKEAVGPGQADTVLLRLLYQELESVESQYSRFIRGAGKSSIERDPTEQITPPQKEVLELYKKILPQLHPALTSSPKERQRRRHLLPKVNDAYVRRDIVSLRAVQDALNREQEKRAKALSKVDDSVVRQMKNRVFDLDMLITRLEGEYHELRYGEAAKVMSYQLLAQSEGYDFLRQLSMDIQQELKDYQQKLREMREHSQ